MRSYPTAGLKLLAELGKASDEADHKALGEARC